MLDWFLFFTSIIISIFYFASSIFICIGKHKGGIEMSDSLFTTIVVFLFLVGVFGLYLTILSSMLVF